MALVYRIVNHGNKIIRSVYWKIFFGSLGSGSHVRGPITVVGKPAGIAIGDRFQIWHRCFLTVGNSGSISCGNDGHLGVDVYINATKGNVRIGNNVAIAAKVQIYSYSDTFAPTKLIGELKKEADVTIGNNVLIGSGAIILPGVTIGDGAIVGAGSVVTKDIDEFEIVAGIPARKIKNRPR